MIDNESLLIYHLQLTELCSCGTRNLYPVLRNSNFLQSQTKRVLFHKFLKKPFSAFDFLTFFHTLTSTLSTLSLTSALSVCPVFSKILLICLPIFSDHESRLQIIRMLKSNFVLCIFQISGLNVNNNFFLSEFSVNKLSIFFINFVSFLSTLRFVKLVFNLSVWVVLSISVPSWGGLANSLFRQSIQIFRPGLRLFSIVNVTVMSRKESKEKKYQSVIQKLPC